MPARQTKIRALLSLCGIALTLLLSGWWLIQPAYAATEQQVICPADGNGPEEMLRSAIQAVNTTPELDSIVISVTGAECLFTLVDVATTSVYGPVGLPIISRNMLIRAVGGRAVIERGNQVPKFRLIETTANLTLENLSLRNGNPGASQAETYARGGAIRAQQALTLTNVLLTKNEAYYGGAVYVLGPLVMDQVTVSHHDALLKAFEGGGIFAVNDLFATNITVTDNLAEFYGGGLYVAGNAVISAATFHENQSTTGNGLGGGLYVGGDLTLTSSQFISNYAGFSGGGVYVLGSSFISETHFMRNVTVYAGGGLAQGNEIMASMEATVPSMEATLPSMEEKTTNIEASTFISNQADIGGGAYVQRTFMQGNRFETNRALGYQNFFGGGAVAVVSEATIQNNLFIRNSAPLGGALHISYYPIGNTGDGSQIVNNLLIDNNASQGNGAAIAVGVDHEVVQGGFVAITHNTIVHQTKGNSSGIYVARSTSDIYNNIITQHRIGVYITGGSALADANLLYKNTINHHGMDSGPNDLIADPLFVNAAQHDYHLQSGSPAQDSGLDVGVGADFDGLSRPQGKGYDRGAFEILYVNHAPIGQAEAYTTPMETPLVVSALGVLNNDSDPDGEPLTATVATVPPHGALVLQPGGAFVYTPTAGYIGTDTFTYHASDGIELSAAIAVTIEVEGEPPTQPVAITGLSATNDGPVAAGNAVNFVASVETGSDIRFAWDFADGATEEGATATHVFAAPGEYVVTLSATNSLGAEHATTKVTVLPDADVQHQLWSPFVVK